MSYLKTIIDFFISIFSRKHDIKEEIKKDIVIDSTKEYMEQKEEIQKIQKDISSVTSDSIKKESQSISFE